MAYSFATHTNCHSQHSDGRPDFYCSFGGTISLTSKVTTSKEMDKAISEFFDRVLELESGSAEFNAAREKEGFGKKYAPIPE